MARINIAVYCFKFNVIYKLLGIVNTVCCKQTQIVLNVVFKKLIIVASLQQNKNYKFLIISDSKTVKQVSVSVRSDHKVFWINYIIYAVLFGRLYNLEGITQQPTA